MALAARDRTVEENVRMLCGQQWIIWSDKIGKFIDVARSMSRDERRYKQRPVVNRITYWFVLNHARMTENPPIIGFEPKTGDQVDAELAAAMDVLSKSLWDDLGMIGHRSDLAAWMLVGGCAYLEHRIDPNKGAPREFYGPATIEGYDEETGETGDYLVAGEDGQPMQVPYNRSPDSDEFVPQIEFDDNGEIRITGEAWKEYEGGLAVSVHGPLECRGEWGSAPWHEKGWHARRAYLTPAEVKGYFGVDCEPDTSLNLGQVGQLERLLRGTGHFGAAKENSLTTLGDGMAEGDPTGLVQIDMLWVKPGHHGTPLESDTTPGGRLLIVTPHKVIRDGERPAKYPFTSPIQRFDMIALPGRPHGSSPQEWLNPLQRLINRSWSQILEHTNLVANPIAVEDAMANIGNITNRPGQRVKVTRRPGVPALEFVAPPKLSDDVYKQLQLLHSEFDILGNIAGTEGRIPSQDASGALMRELRFNSDRYLGSPLRKSAEEFGRFWQSVMATLEVTWDEEKMVHWMGDDDVLRTVAIRPEMWKGKINVSPDLESMLPESRHERQQRVTELWQSGAFGEPTMPEAIRRFFDLVRFPHMGRAVKPGGTQVETARFVMGQIAQGMPVTEAIIYPWYDLDLWILTADEFLSTPMYLRMDAPTQAELAAFREILVAARAAKMLQEAEQMAGIQSATQMTALQTSLASGAPQLEAAASQALAPPDPAAVREPSQGASDDE